MCCWYEQNLQGKIEEFFLQINPFFFAIFLKHKLKLIDIIFFETVHENK